MIYSINDVYIILFYYPLQMDWVTFYSIASKSLIFLLDEKSNMHTYIFKFFKLHNDYMRTKFSKYWNNWYPNMNSTVSICHQIISNIVNSNEIL